MNILFVVPYPEGEAPSQRFRFEQYFDALRGAGHTYTVSPFLDLATWRNLYKPGNGLKKAVGILTNFGRGFKMLFSLQCESSLNQLITILKWENVPEIA